MFCTSFPLLVTLLSLVRLAFSPFSTVRAAGQNQWVLVHGTAVIDEVCIYLSGEDLINPPFKCYNACVQCSVSTMQSK